MSMVKVLSEKGSPCIRCLKSVAELFGLSVHRLVCEACFKEMEPQEYERYVYRRQRETVSL